MTTFGGEDYVDARGGSDVIRGGAGDDQRSMMSPAGLYGDSPSLKADSAKDGDDRLYGQSGSDSLFGMGGSDLLVGGDGVEDHINATEHRYNGFDGPGPPPALSKNPGEDTVRGGAGTDHIYAEDGYIDTIDCGDGVDAVWSDEGLDKVADNCEQKNIDR